MKLLQHLQDFQKCQCRNKVVTEQDELFGDIEVEKSKFHPNKLKIKKKKQEKIIL